MEPEPPGPNGSSKNDEKYCILTDLFPLPGDRHTLAIRTHQTCLGYLLGQPSPLEIWQFNTKEEKKIHCLKSRFEPWTLGLKAQCFTIQPRTHI
jgi:hypothetical protein